MNFKNVFGIIFAISVVLTIIVTSITYSANQSVNGTESKVVTETAISEVTEISLNFSDKHPELLPGEIFLINAHISVFEITAWKTKRLGEVAYKLNGDVIENSDLQPIFVQIDELKAAGIDPNKRELARRRARLKKEWGDPTE